jgi:hypothetical protein
LENDAFALGDVEESGLSRKMEVVVIIRSNFS